MLTVEKNNKKLIVYRRIIKSLFFYKELSNTEISELIGKSIPITIQLLGDLLKEKIIVENGYAVSRGGRRPQTYALKENFFYVISVAMDQLVTRIALISSDNNFIGDVQRYELTLANNPNSLRELISHIKSFIEHKKIPASKIVGIGIGMPGFVDAKRGINNTFLPTVKGTVVSNLEDALGIPVRIDNDSSLIALAESKWGAARQKENVMVINIGWGIGLGIIINGKLFRGQDGFAGEFSHIPLFDNNKLCSCGKYGCLETETSLAVVTQKTIEKLKEGVDSSLNDIILDNIELAAKKIIEAAQRGDKFAIESISDAAYNIGRGVAILIHLLNPELIVISGLGSIAGKVWIAPILQAINEHCIPKIAEHVEVKISSLGYSAELRGALALVMDNYENLKKDLNKNTQKLVAQ